MDLTDFESRDAELSAVANELWGLESRIQKFQESAAQSSYLAGKHLDLRADASEFLLAIIGTYSLCRGLMSLCPAEELAAAWDRHNQTFAKAVAEKGAAK